MEWKATTEKCLASKHKKRIFHCTCSESIKRNKIFFGTFRLWSFFFLAHALDFFASFFPHWKVVLLPQMCVMLWMKCTVDQWIDISFHDWKVYLLLQGAPTVAMYWNVLTTTITFNEWKHNMAGKWIFHSDAIHKHSQMERKSRTGWWK